MPTVAHGMRAHLARTETFVTNQVRSLRRHRSIVVAHHRRPETDVPLGEGVVADEQVPRPLALAQQLAYRTAKVALPSATSALARYVHEQDARLLHLHYVTDARFLLGLQRKAGLPRSSRRTATTCRRSHASGTGSAAATCAPSSVRLTSFSR